MPDMLLKEQTGDRALDLWPNGLDCKCACSLPGTAGQMQFPSIYHMTKTPLLCKQRHLKDIRES